MLSCWPSWSPICWWLEKLEGRGGRHLRRRKGRMLQSWDRRGRTAWREASLSATRISKQNSQAHWQCKLSPATVKISEMLFSGFATTGSWKRWKHLLVSSLPVDSCPSANTRSILKTLSNHFSFAKKYFEGEEVLRGERCHSLPWMVSGAQMRTWHSHLQEPHHRAGDGLWSGESTKFGENQKTTTTMNLLLARSSWRKVGLHQEKLKRQTTFEDLFIFPSTNYRIYLFQ